MESTNADMPTRYLVPKDYTKNDYDNNIQLSVAGPFDAKKARFMQTHRYPKISFCFSIESNQKLIFIMENKVPKTVPDPRQILTQKLQNCLNTIKSSKDKVLVRHGKSFQTVLDSFVKPHDTEQKQDTSANVQSASDIGSTLKRPYSAIVAKEGSSQGNGLVTESSSSDDEGLSDSKYPRFGAVSFAYKTPNNEEKHRMRFELQGKILRGQYQDEDSITGIFAEYEKLLPSNGLRQSLNILKKEVQQNRTTENTELRLNWSKRLGDINKEAKKIEENASTKSAIRIKSPFYGQNSGSIGIG